MPARVSVKAVCAASKESCLLAMAQSGVKDCITDYRELVKREDIDAIDCCTPNYLHFPVVLDALKSGKHVYCEKPLAMNVEEAHELVRPARESGLRNQVAFHYRFVPATMRAMGLIEEGALGQILHFRAQYLHSGYIDPNRPLSWRLTREKGGGGALFDLGSHVVDLMRFLLGDYQDVMARLHTFIMERPDPKRPGAKGKVDVDDLVILQVKMADGSFGIIEASRVATGTNDDLRFEIHGTKGAVMFSLMEPNWLWFYDAAQPQEPLGGRSGFIRIETIQRYPKPATGFPGPKSSIGWTRYHLASQFDFLRSLSGEGYEPLGAAFEDGLRVQEVLEAAERSNKIGGWVNVRQSAE
ncbi:MAG TPA: Gfo/Idh/MocA family oxidoreductase [Firmicutes bacterium]|nr:Gfo/Idh/MocA family oxidoreductase [Bacillota bacterium]